MTIYQSQPSDVSLANTVYKAYSPTSNIKATYRDTSGVNAGTDAITVNQIKFDLTYGFSEQILSDSVRFKIGDDVFIDRDAVMYRNIDAATNSGTASGEIRYGTGEVILNAWTPNVANTLALESLTTTTDLLPLSHMSFRTPIIPIRVQSMTIAVSTLEHGVLTLTADENGVIETPLAHGKVNYETGFTQIYFYQKVQLTIDNRAEIEAEPWYFPELQYQENGATYVNKPVLIDGSSVRYNAIGFTYLPLDPDVLGLQTARLPINGRVPIFRVGGYAMVSALKTQTLESAIAGTTYNLNHQRISYCELEDANGVKVDYDLYTVDYDYGRVSLGGDFVLANLVEPLVAQYRYQDLTQIRDVQINGQLTFTKRLTHNYEAADTVVASVLVINDMQARYTSKFTQQTWTNQWSDAPAGTPISANYNDALYPFEVTNKGAIQERWYLLFTGAQTFKCIGEYSGEIATGTTFEDFAPINPVTGVPYFVIKKEGWGAGWSNGNILRFNTIAAMKPIWIARTVQQSEPSEITDDFQIMLNGDIDRIV